MQFKAKLDSIGIYLGVEPVEELQPGDIEVPEDCDLKPGAYRWNAKDVRFDPLPRTRIHPAPDVPSVEDALYALILGTENPPAVCAAWAKALESSIGALGNKFRGL